MAWSASKIFATFIEDALENVAAYDLGATPDTFKVVLYDSGITPDNTVSTANRTYDAGVWAASGNECADGTEWDAGGEPLADPALTVAAAVVKFDGTDTVSGGTSATLTDVAGCLIVDSTLSNVGLCYNYFGATPAAVGDGTFTVVWAGTGIFTITLT